MGFNLRYKEADHQTNPEFKRLCSIHGTHFATSDWYGICPQCETEREGTESLAHPFYTKSQLELRNDRFFQIIMGVIVIVSGYCGGYFAPTFSFSGYGLILLAEYMSLGFIAFYSLFNRFRTKK